MNSPGTHGRLRYILLHRFTDMPASQGTVRRLAAREYHLEYENTFVAFHVLLLAAVSGYCCGNRGSCARTSEKVETSGIHFSRRSRVLYSVINEVL